MATVEAIRELALGLPRSYEAWVRGRRKFRVGRIVYLACDARQPAVQWSYL